MADKSLEVKETIALQLSRDAKKLGDDDRLVEDLKADENDLKQIFGQLEDEFSLTITEDDRKRIKTVVEVIKYVNSHTEEEE